MYRIIAVFFAALLLCNCAKTKEIATPNKPMATEYDECRERDQRLHVLDSIYVANPSNIQVAEESIRVRDTFIAQCNLPNKYHVEQQIVRLAEFHYFDRARLLCNHSLIKDSEEEDIKLYPYRIGVMESLIMGDSASLFLYVDSILTHVKSYWDQYSDIIQATMTGSNKYYHEMEDIFRDGMVLWLLKYYYGYMIFIDKNNMDRLYADAKQYGWTSIRTQSLIEEVEGFNPRTLVWW